MSRSPCCDDNSSTSGLKKGPWTPEEDEKLIAYIDKNGSHGSWRSLPKAADLNRCGKSCRLRWTNYLRPGIKRGSFSQEEEDLIIKLHSILGNKWSRIATHLSRRTDNEIKNYWNTHIRKKLLQMGIDPVTHKPMADLNLLAKNLSQLLCNTSNLTNLTNPWDNNYNINNALTLQPNVADLAKLELLQNIFHILSPNNNESLPNIDQISPLNPGILPPQVNALDLSNPSQNDPNFAMCSSSSQFQNFESNLIMSSSLDESRSLPCLVNLSSELSNMNKKKKKQKIEANCTNNGSSGEFFEGLEKLLDDDDDENISDSFSWKDFIN